MRQPASPAIHPFTRKKAGAHLTERVMFWIFRLAAYSILVCATYIFLDISIKGSATVFRSSFPFISVEFLTGTPQTLHVFEYEGEKMELSDKKFRRFCEERNIEEPYSETYAYSGGGIFPCIAGTVLLVLGSMAIALVLGVCSAIYLSEYAKDGLLIRLIRVSILNLAGVPSIVFGLFGFGVFVLFFGWNVSLLAGWFTLAFMVLPIVITASEEALRGVPQGFREGALALGATKWQAIRTNVLPYAFPGILTSSILSIARVAGETAPIMFTAAYAIRNQLPWEVEKFSDFFFQGVMALPYHIYVVSRKIPQNEYSAKMQYGTAFVFLAIVAALAFLSIVLRMKMRKRYRW